MANHLPVEKKSLILNLLAEGNSIRSIVRISGASKNTVSKLLLDAGSKAREILDREMVNLDCSRLEVDEIWCFVQKKQAMLTDEERYEDRLGDQYVFVALDPKTKLVPTFLVGKRTLSNATSFMYDLKNRVRSRFQLTTDAFVAYTEAVDFIFGADIDYAQIHKQYKSEYVGERRYSPPKISGVIIKPIIGEPIKKYISTSLVERQNLTIRMQMRRFTRLTNAFSKSLKHLNAALALHFYHYNFMRIHQTTRVTPAMEGKVTRRMWTWNDLLGVGIQPSIAA